MEPKKTILLSNKYAGIPLEILQEEIGDDFFLKMLPEVSQTAFEESIEDADYLLLSGRVNLNSAVLDKAHRLKMIQRTGVGLDNADLDCIKKRNIPFYINRGVNAVSVAEYTIMLILGILKNTRVVNSQIRNGIWKKQETGLTTFELHNKTVGIIGMGNIGRKVAEILKGFGVVILYYDVFRVERDDEERLGISYCSFEDLLKNADIITLHCGYDKQTGAIITEKEFGLMKNGVIVINTARGKLIDQNALVQALESGKVKSCGIDTFEAEPINENNELLKFDNILLSPHIAGVSYDAFKRMMSLGVDNIRCFDAGNLEAIKNNRLI